MKYSNEIKKLKKKNNNELCAQHAGLKRFHVEVPFPRIAKEAFLKLKGSLHQQWGVQDSFLVGSVLCFFRELF